jgi:hypothetical protein
MKINISNYIACALAMAFYGWHGFIIVSLLTWATFKITIR